MKQSPNTNSLLQDVGETVGYLEIYAQRQVQIAKLEAAEKTATMMASLATGLILGAFGMVIICCLSVGLAFLLHQSFAISYASAFFILSGFYVVIITLFYLFRRYLLTNPILEMLIKMLFSNKQLS